MQCNAKVNYIESAIIAKKRYKKKVSNHRLPRSAYLDLNQDAMGRRFLVTAFSNLSECCSSTEKRNADSYVWIVDRGRDDALIHQSESGESSHGDGAKGSVDGDGTAVLRGAVTVTAAAA